MDRIQNLILERNLFEIQVYDYLVDPFLFISEDFWEPVKVGLSVEQISKCEELVEQDECIICTNICNTFRKLDCCNNKLCTNCINNWFTESVRCPFCICDIRELHLKNKRNLKE